MTENHRVALTEKQKEAIAEQLAEFFFGFWENRQKISNTQSVKSSGEAIALEPGFSSEDFPGSPGQ